MIKCPYCHFENEDGALFCERCTSDLTGVASSTPAAAPKPPPVPPAIPMAEHVPFEAIPVAKAEPLDTIPVGTVANATPIEIKAVSLPAALTMESVEPYVPAAEPEPVPAPDPPPPGPVLTPTPMPATAGSVSLPAGSQPRLLVQRGQKRNVEYPIYEGLNFLGRADEKPVDIDLEEQEPPDRIWCSRQHACISWEGDQLAIEDLNSANGTYVNRMRVYPGTKQPLVVNDIIQIGNVQLKVLA